MMKNEHKIMRCYFDMWKRGFDFKGKSTNKEFWTPYLVHIIMTVLYFILNIFYYFTYSDTVRKVLMILILFFTLYFVLALVPSISLGVRRLHDTGKSGWWYLLSAFLGIGTVTVLIMCSLSSIAFVAADNENVEVYGPPEMFESTDESYSSEDYNTETNYNPEYNENISVYGPPEMME